MDRNIAELMLTSFSSMAQKIDSFYKVIETIDDKDEKAKFLKSLGEIIVKLNSDFIYPIVKQYPDLDPDK